MVRLITLTAFAVFSLFSASAAQWINAPVNDSVVRPSTHVVTVASVLPTSSTITTLDTVVNNFDLSTAPTSVPASSITAPIGPRSLAIRIVDASGSSLRVTVTISGQNIWGKNVTEIFDLTAAAPLGLTRNAFVSKPTITLAVTGAAASDLLHIGPYGFGVLLNNPVRLNVSLFNGTTVVNDAGTFDGPAGVYIPAGIDDVGNILTIYGYSTGRSEPLSGLIRHAGSTTAF